MRFIAKTIYGLEGILARELSDLGASDIVTANRAVLFQGNLELMYAVNYMSRFAVSVLLQVAEFHINSPDDLYALGSKIRWDRYFGPGDTFMIKPVVKSGFFNHTGFAALKLKDSIADFFRKEFGTRPAVDTQNPGIIISLHISNRHVTVSLDSSGDPLFKRGYRRGTLEAPLNEVLAAGMIRLSGWDGQTDITDPMCGSGTIPVEAAMMASNMPPGKSRSSFGFQRWKSYDEQLFSRIRADFDSRIRKPAAAITGSDISEKAVRQTIDNARSAGVENYVNISACDFRNLKPAGQSGFLILNPPYGERLSRGETDSLYSTIGSVLKHSFSGYKACLITSNMESVKQVGLKPAAKFTLFNGSLECLYLVYDLYEGSRKRARSNQNNN